LFYNKNYRKTESMNTASPYLTAILALILVTACTDADRFIAGGVKEWCERDVHCGRSGSDPTPLPNTPMPSRENPSGAPL
jgi:hypothetical protein